MKSFSNNLSCFYSSALSVMSYHFCSTEWRPGPWFSLHNSPLCSQTYPSFNDFVFKTAVGRALKIERETKRVLCKVFQPTAVFTRVKMFRLVPFEVPLRESTEPPTCCRESSPGCSWYSLTPEVNVLYVCHRVLRQETDSSSYCVRWWQKDGGWVSVCEMKRGGERLWAEEMLQSKCQKNSHCEMQAKMWMVWGCGLMPG